LPRSGSRSWVLVSISGRSPTRRPIEEDRQSGREYERQLHKPRHAPRTGRPPPQALNRYDERPRHNRLGVRLELVRTRCSDQTFRRMYQGWVDKPEARNR
jgi:hypothetical protein